MAATTSAADLHGQWYDYIVVGLGGIGSAALYWLSKRSGKSEYIQLSIHNCLYSSTLCSLLYILQKGSGRSNVMFFFQNLVTVF